MDMQAIQRVLRDAGYYDGQIDGIAGTKTDRAIRDFQKANGLKVDGIVGPKTLAAMFPGTESKYLPESVESGAILSRARLRRMWPRGRQSLIDGMAAASGAVLPAHGIVTKIRLCHFMAQISHECGGGTVVEENLHHTRAQTIVGAWPSRFTLVSAAPYVRNGRALANKVYNGRMGNRPGTDDGWNYRGRGPIQITGRDGYETIGKIAGLDLLRTPTLANDDDTALLIAASFWTWKNLNAVCDQGLSDKVLVAVTKKVNGGTNGLKDRRAWFAKWKRELGLS